MFYGLKFLIQKICSPKYVRKGKCLSCGNCCRNILLCTADNKAIRSKEQFEKIKKFDKHFYNFYISGKSENGELLFTCRELGEDNKCKVYFFRGLGCRKYPKTDTKFLINHGKPLDGCGYYFEASKKFGDYLNDYRK